MHFARGEEHGPSVSRVAVLYHGLHSFAYGRPCVQPCQNILVRVQRHCPRQGEGGSSPQMVKRRDTHVPRLYLCL